MKKKVLITGANGSLGFSLTKKFFTEEYQLFLNVRKINTQLNNLIKLENKKIRLIKGDLTKTNTINSIAKIIKKNKIKILINNSGIHSNKKFQKIKKDEILNVFNVNFFSNVLLLKEILNFNVQELTIININSVAGLQGSENESIYSASKHALKGFYESLEKEKSLHKFNFINLFSGAFKSKITRKRKNYNNLIQPDEIADVVFKLSNDYKSLKINNIFIKRKIY